jgi:hypothetical protein
MDAKDIMRTFIQWKTWRGLHPSHISAKTPGQILKGSRLRGDAGRIGSADLLGRWDWILGVKGDKRSFGHGGWSGREDPS